MDQILKILGIEDSSQIDPGRNLGQMGMDSFVGVEISQLLQSHANVNVTMQEIQELTLEEIKNLLDSGSERTVSQAPTLLTTAKITLPPTLTHKEPLIPIHQNAPGQPIFIVNIGDTDVSNFQVVSKGLNRPLYALVWTKDVPPTDIESLASYYLKLEKDVLHITSQEERIQTIVKRLTSSSGETVNSKEVSEALSNFIIKYRICKFYNPKASLSMDINIIENSTKLLANDVARVKDSFGKVCTGKISVHRACYTFPSSNKDVQQLIKILQAIV
ncbi:fatty acid synthase [Nephila pilipes]|nr:fatty acid synthase [Nephila pilipes]